MDERKDKSVAGIKQKVATTGAYDRTVSDLFTCSLGPVKPLPPTTAPTSLPNALNQGEDQPLSALDLDTHSEPSEDRASAGSGALDSSNADAIPIREVQNSGAEPRRRRKRDRQDDVEGVYLQRIAKEEAKHLAQREVEGSYKRRKVSTTNQSLERSTITNGNRSDTSAVDESTGEVNKDDNASTPQHESLTSSRETLELEKAARTVFLANVNTLCIKSKTAKKALLGHLVSFCMSLPTADARHKVESIRFRSTPFSNSVGPKKAAYAKKELMDSTTKSTNAYVVYSTQIAAREAVKRLNGTVLLNRHLLVDSVAHPRKTDHRRCVFVGNLGFVDDDSQISAAQADIENRKRKLSAEPSDVEEGLWRQFSMAGAIESVRVVRDSKTRVGKGFAYVQFMDEIAVEKALLYNDKKFPPLLPRILRVSRAKKTTKMTTRKIQYGGKNEALKSNASGAQYIPKIDPIAQSLSGRAGKLFGRAGAAHLQGRASLSDKHSTKGPKGAAEQIVFEGHRASSRQGRDAKLGGSGKKQGKPRTRSSRRGAAFKAKGSKQPGSKG